MGVVALMQISGIAPRCYNQKGALFEKEIKGQVKEIRKECSGEQRLAIEKYLEAFDVIGQRVAPYAASLSGQPSWDGFTDTAKGVLEKWMKGKRGDLHAVFTSMESAPIIPETCALQREPTPFVPGAEQKGFAAITFWILPTKKANRHLVEVNEAYLTSYGPASLLGNKDGYDLQYTKASSYLEALELSAKHLSWTPTDSLVITSEFRRDNWTYTLQMGWSVPATEFRDESALRDYLSSCGPGFYAFDVSAGKTAFFRKLVEDAPSAKPLVDW